MKQTAVHPVPEVPRLGDSGESTDSEVPTREIPKADKRSKPLAHSSAAQTLKALQPVSFRDLSGQARLGIQVRGVRKVDPTRVERHAPMDLLVVVMRVVQEQQKKIETLEKEVGQLRRTSEAEPEKPAV